MTLTHGITIRSATPEDATAIRTLVATSFGGRPDEDELDRYRQLFPPADAIVAADGARIVGHVQSRTMTVTVPGERAVDACGIAAVGVAPTHRRRGILIAMYTEQHRRTEAAGLPLTIFTASEATIYGRFGYGPTVRENAVTIDRRFAEFRPTAPDPGGVDLAAPDEVAEHIKTVYDRWRRLVPGAQVRPDASWAGLFADAERSRRGGTSLFVFTHPDGYALYRYHYRETGMDVDVVELRAVTTEAHAALWRALLGLDLVKQVSVTLSDNDPLPYLLTDTRLVRTTGRYDGLWLRLMDIPAALTARIYQRDLDLVLAVTDPFREAGGTFALTVRDGLAECAPTTGAADIELGIDVLGSMYLGAYPARVFAAANRLQAKDSNHLRAIEEAFGTDRDAVLGWFF
ncbi:GNAT family N-acetyltransferase [Nocardia sp. XZ_19_369]|uniref:GNAT family N-acetyltransferase n=1 Tax=Nocardia sp. XZ_19_369 TaxID=2769487 RepID=UPI00188F273F|nr:GNAT family N-acetyltransferase [Nocardia sp. XZ_19_369]